MEDGGKELTMLTDHNGVSVLWIAAEIGHLGVAQALMKVGGRELIMLATENGDSAVQVAARQVHVGAVRALEVFSRSSGAADKAV